MTNTNGGYMFEVGKTYEMSFITECDARVYFKCIKRSAKMAMFVNDDETIKRKIFVCTDGIERVYYGNYSMAPCLSANGVVNQTLN